MKQDNEDIWNADIRQTGSSVVPVGRKNTFCASRALDSRKKYKNINNMAV